MSEYGEIWEQIRLVRTKIAETIGEPVDKLHTLETSIRIVAIHHHRLTNLLAAWAQLEALAAKLDPDTGEKKR